LKTKWNLTKSEQRAHSANSARLMSAGLAIAVESTASSEPPPLTLEQSGDGFIRAGARAGMALGVWVRLTVLKSGITICDSEITIPGCDDTTIVFVDPPDDSANYKVLDWINLEWDVVLNHRIFSERPLPRGTNLEGFVVAQSLGPLASQFQTGMNIGAKICLSDQSDNFYSSEVELRVERRPQPGLHARTGSGLFGPRAVVEPAPCGALETPAPMMRNERQSRNEPNKPRLFSSNVPRGVRET
jgi:hypothetical protein